MEEDFQDFQDLTEIAQKIKVSNKKVTLLYAFNATGKTRLSMEFKNLVNEVTEDDETIKHVLYYNAFTEDLFSWDNDLENNCERKLKINTDSTFVNLIEKQGKENEIAEKFRRFTSSKIEPEINTKTGEVIFILPTGDNDSIKNIKISKAEESIFIWSVFQVLIETVIEELNIHEVSDRSTDEFNSIQYIFIDDPVSSLDDNHAIEVAIDIMELIKNSKNNDLNFIISTHHALFYNVLFNEFKRNNRRNKSYLLKKENEKFLLSNVGDSPFGYHLAIKQEIQNAILDGRIEKYHFSLLRNLLEKTATYLGYDKWSDLLVGSYVDEDNKQAYVRRINLYSHNQHSDLDYRELQPAEKEMLKLLFNGFIKTFNFKGGKNV